MIKRWRVLDMPPMVDHRFRENPDSCASGPTCRPGSIGQPFVAASEQRPESGPAIRAGPMPLMPD